MASGVEPYSKAVVDRLYDEINDWESPRDRAILKKAGEFMASLWELSARLIDAATVDRDSAEARTAKVFDANQLGRS